MKHRDAIIHLLRQGRPYSEIAAKLRCAKSTVAFHAKRIGVAPGTRRVGRADIKETKRKVDAGYRNRNRERLRCYYRELRRLLKLETLKRYGLTCACCGFDDVRALQIDHIDGSGAAERKGLGGRHFAGHNFYSVLKKRGWPEGYQTLCANCNIIKYSDTLVK